MLKKYVFHIDGNDVAVETDDSIRVKELIEIILERIDCYEPLGIDSVRIFEGYSEKNNSGWYIDNILQPLIYFFYKKSFYHQFSK